jgi:two-component system, OmpR family, response regulator
MTRVLVIDDEPDVVDVLSRVLEKRGYQVISAPDSNAGLALCREQTPDVVVTDIIMPGEHGVDLIRRLRSEFPGIGIIAITGGGNAAVAGYQPGAVKTAAYVAAAEVAGADFCLTKPFERDDLLSSIESLVGRNRTIN